jgi:ornithine cyclodeaminase/alanine dehydrogenase-like protein (mu-crystallin family)
VERRLSESGDVILKATVYAEVGEILSNLGRRLPQAPRRFQIVGIAIEDIATARLV